jgi:hypothetical protein
VCARLDATPAPWSGPRRIPTPTMWPTLAVDVLPTISGGPKDDATPEPEGTA